MMTNHGNRLTQGQFSFLPDLSDEQITLGTRHIVSQRRQELVHLGLKDPERDYGPEHVPGSVTGSLHHVAFACEDYDAAKARLDAFGAEYRTTEVSGFDFRQIVLKDPNNINLELNFAGR